MAELISNLLYISSSTPSSPRSPPRPLHNPLLLLLHHPERLVLLPQPERLLQLNLPPPGELRQHKILSTPADIKGLFVCDIRDFLSGGHKGTFRMQGHYAPAFGIIYIPVPVEKDAVGEGFIHLFPFPRTLHTATVATKLSI